MILEMHSLSFPLFFIKPTHNFLKISDSDSARMVYNSKLFSNPVISLTLVTVISFKSAWFHSL